MKKCACPNCEKPTISFWQKQKLGLGRSVACRACGAVVTVSWPYGLAYLVLGSVLPLFGGASALLLVNSVPSLLAIGTFTAVFVLGMLLTLVPLSWLYHWYAPLQSLPHQQWHLLMFPVATIAGGIGGFYLAGFICVKVLVASGLEYSHGHIGVFTLVALAGALVGAVLAPFLLQHFLKGKAP